MLVLKIEIWNKEQKRSRLTGDTLGVKNVQDGLQGGLILVSSRLLLHQLSPDFGTTAHTSRDLTTI